MSRSRITWILTLLALIVAAGTVFFRFVEGWSWLDAYFFTVVTLSTVGYGELVPATALGKIGTTVFIFFGLGVFVVAIQHFGAFTFRQNDRPRLPGASASDGKGSPRGGDRHDPPKR